MAGLNQLLSGSSKLASAQIIGTNQPLKERTEAYIDYPRIPTGVFPFDYAVGGGIPCNTPTQFYGPYQGGKSLLSYLAARGLSRICMRCGKPLSICKCPTKKFVPTCPTCGKPAGECSHKTAPVELCETCGKTRLECTCNSKLIQKTFLCHLEGLPPDELFFRTLGYDATQNMVIGLPEYGEQACEMIEAAIKSDDCGLIIVDSLADLVPKEELDCAYEDAKVALQSRLIARLFRRIATLLVQEYRKKHLVGIIFLNQIRANIGGGMFGPTETTPGGWSSKHGYRLSVRVNQLALDAKSGEREQNGVKNVSRFSISMLGSEAKQQMLILSGKAEYKIALRDWDGYLSGSCIDANAAIAIAKELGMLEKNVKNYELKGTGMEFKVLSDIEKMFATGVYQHPDTGEVIEYGADIFRQAVIKRAKSRIISSISNRSGSVQEIRNPLRS